MSIRIRGWPVRTTWPTSTKRFVTFPGTRNPRSLCTRAVTTPVKERMLSEEAATAVILTSWGCVRGSFAAFTVQPTRTNVIGAIKTPLSFRKVISLRSPYSLHCATNFTLYPTWFLMGPTRHRALGRSRPPREQPFLWSGQDRLLPQEVVDPHPAHRVDQSHLPDTLLGNDL